MEDARTILTIDDSPTNQKLIQRILTPSYKVVQADSGVQGLELLDEVAPNLILLDVDMPGINGYDTCREIRTHRGFESVPILFFSCLTDPKDHLQGYEAGADDYINKPVDIDVLRAKIAVNLQRRSQIASEPAKPQLVRSDEILANFLNTILFSYECQAVGQALFKACSELGLELAIRMHLPKQKRSFANVDDLSTLEDILLDKAESLYPIQNGARLVLGSESFVVLVRNIRTLGDRMQEHHQQLIAKMLDAANERIRQIK